MRGISVLLFVALVAAVRGQVEECPADQGTNWEIEQLLRHEDCNKFYKCTLGHPIEYSCYDGLYFNLDTWQCDWPHNVDCTGRNDPALTTLAPEPTTAEPTTTTTTTTTTPAPTTTTTTTTTPAPTTTTTTTTTPAPTTTTTTTTTPAPTTTTTTTTTPAPTTSSSTHAPECEIEVEPEVPETPETEAPATEAPEEQEIDFLQNGCPVDPHIHWLLPNEEDCNLFYYCVWGELVLRECPPTLHFNPVLQVCDWPQAAGCAVSVNKHAEARRQLLKQILL